MREKLPQELMIDIFTRLPVKSILQCTSLNKSWYALINSPNFISTHLNRRQDNDILIRHFSENPENEVYTLFHDDENPNQFAQFDFPFNCINYFFNIVGTCNGILCLNDELCYWSTFYLWNPAIRKSLKLPNPIIRTDGGFDFTLGFGFDPVTNDYKVVRVSHTDTGIPPGIEVFKLSTGVWKDISHVAPPDIVFYVAQQVYLNGASHWIGSKWEEECSWTVIVTFDMCDEKFAELKLPDSVADDMPEEVVLFLSHESLCLYNHAEAIDIWMMKEYGEAESWVKLYSIRSRDVPYGPGVDHKLMTPLAIRKNGEVLWIDDKGVLSSVNHADKKIKYPGIHDSAHTYHLMHDSLVVSSYKESLVLLDKWRDYCVEDPCDEGHTHKRKKLLKTNAKRRIRIASLLHIFGLLYKMKTKLPRRKERKKRVQADAVDLL